MASPLATALTITQTITSATGALLEGDHSGALALLQSALTHAKVGLEREESQLTQGFRRQVNFQLHALPLELEGECGNNGSLQASCPCSLFTFYNAALITDEMCAPWEFAFASELSATILYNLGLVYHRIALATGSTSYFSKALRLYDVAASIVLTPSPMEQNHDLTVLKLALCVNMGHIYSNFCDQTGTRRCAVAMQEIFNSTDPNAFSGELRKIFYMNMLVTQNPHFMGVAPAA